MIAHVFEGTVNRMVSGYLLREMVNRINQVNFTATDDVYTLGMLYESMLKEMRDAAGDSGEFYTPRAVVKFMVTVTDPKLGETVLDPACGTGGFLVESFEHLKGQVRTIEDRQALQWSSIYGVEAKPLPYLLAQMNLLLHGLEYPNIEYQNALAVKIGEIGEADQAFYAVQDAGALPPEHCWESYAYGRNYYIVDSFLGSSPTTVFERGVRVDAQTGNILPRSPVDSDPGTGRPPGPGEKVPTIWEIGFGDPAAQDWLRKKLTDKSKWSAEGRSSTPEKVWNQMKAALLRGDIEGALRCFAPLARDQYREEFQALGPDARVMAQRMKDLIPREIQVLQRKSQRRQ